MSKYIIILFLTILFTFGCSSQSTEKDKKLAEVEKFIGYLKHNKPDEIYKMSYHVDHENSITDKESREFYVAQAAELIKKNGLPPKEKWVYSYEPNNIIQRHRFKVPLQYDSLNNKLCIELVIAFLPPQISNKIFQFTIDKNLDCIKFEAPFPLPTDRMDSNQ